MTKKISTIILLTLLASCANWMSEEAKNSGKSAAASGRVNASESNSQGIFKELNE